MRVKEVIVHGLFGRFNHRIDLKEGGITIIHGPNGYGKTTILKMVEAVLSKRFHLLRKQPFNLFSVKFDSGAILNVTREESPLEPNQSKPKKKPRSKIDLKIEYFDSGNKKRFEYKVESQRSIEELHMPFEIIEKVVPHLSRVGVREWLDNSTGDVLSLEEIMELLPANFQMNLFRHPQKPPDLFKEFDFFPSVHFIQTQRLLTMRLRSTVEERGAGSAQMVSAADEYSKEISKLITDQLAQSGVQSQELDRSFPNRLLQKPLSDQINESILRQKYSQQLEKRAKLVEAGLSDEAKEEVDLPQRTLDDTEKRVLWFYLADVQNKLDAFDDLQQRIELLRSIINDRFLFKTLSIDKQRGFVFKTDEGRLIDPKDLSSGEQHELILLYQLLFKVKKGSLLLIDEPELSLHVAWQKKFLSDVARIVKVNEFDFLIATHSPQIIHNKWDLTVELEGDKK